MNDWLQSLRTVTAHDQDGGLGQDVESAVAEIDRLRAELAAAISIMQPLALSSKETGVSYGWCKETDSLGFRLHGKAVGDTVEALIKAKAAKEKEARDDPS